jgi:stage V sporulation protein B
LLIPSAVQDVTNPVMANMYGKGDLEGVRRVFYSTLKKSFLISAGTAVFLAVCSPYIISFLFGELFLASYVPLLLLLPGFAISASFTAVGATLSSINKVHIIFRIGAVCLALDIILNILLIPFFGIAGAAIATSIAAIVNFWVNMVIIGKYLTTK